MPEPRSRARWRPTPPLLLMEKYQDLPMDMADAALVRVAEREDIRRILTLDRRDFSVYRLARKGPFTILP